MKEDYTSSDLYYLRYIAPVEMALRKRSIMARKRRGALRMRRKYRNRGQRRSKRLMLKNSTRSVARSIGTGVPDRMFMKFRWAQITTWSVPSTTMSNQAVFYSSLASPFGTAHQCLWYDQWCPNIYTRYRVYGIRYDITVSNRNTSEGWWLAVRPQNTLVPETNMQTLIERNDSKIRMGGSWGGNRSSVRVKGYMGVAKTMGITRSEVKNEEWYAADYNANPVKQAALYVYVQQNNAAAVLMDVTIKLTYYAELFGKAVPGQS